MQIRAPSWGISWEAHFYSSYNKWNWHQYCGFFFFLRNIIVYLTYIRYILDLILTDNSLDWGIRHSWLFFYSHTNCISYFSLFHIYLDLVSCYADSFFWSTRIVLVSYLWSSRFLDNMHLWYIYMLSSRQQCRWRWFMEG